MDINNILFTIAIPAFKSTFLRECIESILNQTLQNFEIIIVNDDSPQDIDGIIIQYDDSRIKYYKNAKNFGAHDVIKNWNECLKHATGDYIICMGDDDMLKPNCLKDYQDLISLYPQYDIYHTRTEIIDENSNVIDILDGRPTTESVFAMIWYLWRGRRQFIGDWLFKTKPLKERGGFFFLPYAWGADHISAFEAAKEKGVANVQNIGFMYRENRMNITKSTNNTDKKIEAMIKSRTWYENFLKKAIPQDDSDFIYKELISKKLYWYINRRIAFDLSELMSSNPINIFKWLFYKKKYNLSFKTIIFSFALSFYKNK